MNYMNDKKMTTAATFLAVVISTLMLVAPVLANTHDSSAEWKETGDISYKVGQNKDMVTSITVTNESGDDIDNIQIVSGISPEPTGTTSEGSELMADNGNPRFDSTMSQKIEPDETETIVLGRSAVTGVNDLYDSGGSSIASHSITINEDSIEVTNDSSDNFTVEKVEYTLDDGDIPNGEFFLPEGTVVTLNGTLSVNLIENTEFIVPEGENVYNVNASENVILREDGTVYVPDTGYTMSLQEDENISPVDGKLSVTLSNARVKLLEDTSFVGTDSPQNVSLPENTNFELMENHLGVSINLGSDTDNLTFEDEVNANTSHWSLGDDNLMKAAEPIAVTTPSGYEQNLSEDSKVELWDSENLIVQEGTKFNSTNSPNVDITKGSELVREKDTELELVNLDDFTQKPDGWDGQSLEDHFMHDVDYAEFTASDSEDYLSSGSSVDIPIAVGTGSTDGENAVYVRTTDTEGTTRISKIIMDVDAKAPEVVDWAASPEWAGENVQVDITIEMSETLGVAPDVAVMENNGEYSPVDVEASQDNTVYEGVYTTGDNIDRDGKATILVENFEDAVGNEAGSYDNENVFVIDRVAPTTPNLKEINNWPVDEIPATDGIQTNVSSYLWEATADVENNYKGSNEPLQGTVDLKYNGQWHTVSPDDSGYWNSEVDMEDGEYEIGVKYTDRAGNESEENLENITIDSTAPTIEITNDMEDGAYVPDNQPTIALSITDELLGIENKVGTYHGDETPEYDDNVGYMVLLASPDFASNVSEENFLSQLDMVSTETVSYYDVDAETPEYVEWYSLANSMAFDNNNNEVAFESDLENSKEDGIELAEEKYAVYVVAGDNLQTGTKSLEFTVDITAPSPNFTYGEYGNNMDSVKDADGEIIGSGKATSTDTWTWSGTSDEEGSTIVMTNAEGDELGSAVVNDDKEWEIEVTFDEDGRRFIELQEVDRAGNTSEKQRWGSITIDTTKPVIEWDEDTKALDGTETNESSIDIKATITDEIAEPNEDLTVTVSAPNYDIPESGVTLGDEGVLDIDVPLEEGPNTIKVTAIDGTKNVATDSIKVTRTVAPWAMYATIAAIIAIILAALAILRRQ